MTNGKRDLIISLRKRGWPVNAIARDTGFSESTVRKIAAGLPVPAGLSDATPAKPRGGKRPGAGRPRELAAVTCPRCGASVAASQIQKHVKACKGASE